MTSDADDLPRLSKRMGELGLCSRREAEAWIVAGWVKVDGQIVDVLGTRVSRAARIEVDPRARAQQAELVTVLLNKPIGYVSGQAEDGYEPASVLVTPANRWEEDRGLRWHPAFLRGLAPAGRLDIDSTGLLVLTQDGRVARQLVGEDSGVEKEYLVRVSFGEVTADVERAFPREGLARLRHGLSLDGKPLKPARVDWQNPEQLRFVLREGKKRQIRRMCEYFDYTVRRLRRVRVVNVELGALPAGRWRDLTSAELAGLLPDRFTAPAAPVTQARPAISPRKTPSSRPRG